MPRCLLSPFVHYDVHAAPLRAPYSPLLGLYCAEVKLLKGLSTYCKTGFRVDCVKTSLK